MIQGRPAKYWILDKVLRLSAALVAIVFLILVVLFAWMALVTSAVLSIFIVLIGWAPGLFLLWASCAYWPANAYPLSQLRARPRAILVIVYLAGLCGCAYAAMRLIVAALNIVLYLVLLARHHS